ncbi:MAG: PIG-L family deacetylase [Kiritimatiellae bacterium]|nr:PIG-L family deacetylase [Kiritimatiellia bacterium]
MRHTLLLALTCMATTAFGGGRERVVFVCAHPDDLAGCSGTALLLAEKFDVRIVDFTRGENGLGEAGYRDGSTARLRIAEERAACAMLGTEPYFLCETNHLGDAHAGREVTKQLADLFKELEPRAVILHWPLDVHPDHVQSTAAALHALYLAKLKPEIYFQEQTTQSRTFQPAYHVNITRVKERKDKLIMCYTCQDAAGIRKRKEDDSIFRGRRIGVPHAEAFGVFEGSVKANRSIFNEIDPPGIR